MSIAFNLFVSVLISSSGTLSTHRVWYCLLAHWGTVWAFSQLKELWGKGVLLSFVVIYPDQPLFGDQFSFITKVWCFWELCSLPLNYKFSLLWLLETQTPILCECQDLFGLLLSSVFPPNVWEFPLMYAQISIQSKTPGDPSEDLGILGISLFLSLSLKVPPLQCSVHKF